jgi:hypothetical protein
MICDPANALGAARFRTLRCVRDLAALSDWPPVGALLEVARSALDGEEGIDASELSKLETMRRTWVTLCEPVREFWVWSAPIDETASVALYRVLTGGRLRGWQVGKLRGLWRKRYAMECPYLLEPTRLENGHGRTER